MISSTSLLDLLPNSTGRIFKRNFIAHLFTYPHHFSLTNDTSKVGGPCRMAFCLLTGPQMGASEMPYGSQRGATWEPAGRHMGAPINNQSSEHEEPMITRKEKQPETKGKVSRNIEMMME